MTLTEKAAAAFMLLLGANAESPPAPYDTKHAFAHDPRAGYVLLGILACVVVVGGARFCVKRLCLNPPHEHHNRHNREARGDGEVPILQGNNSGYGAA